jgi:hypothetical protein
MTGLRRHRLLTVLLALWALVFAQLALAGYSCPGAARAVEIAQMTEAGMPCAESMSRAMDDEQAGLCQAHCQGSNQTADTYQVPALASIRDLGVVLIVPLRLTPTEPLPSFPERPNASPPLAIANCCFRI